MAWETDVFTYFPIRTINQTFAAAATSLPIAINYLLVIMSVSSCCLKGFEWDGSPTERIGKIVNNETYVTGDNPDAGVMV